MPKATKNPPAPSPIDARIYRVRGQAVMLDSDLAGVYGVETRRINEAVKRNPKRFTPLYSFQLAQNEWDILMSQTATSRSEWGGRRKMPRVFTEHGAVMLATVLNSDRAIQASMVVVEAFVRLRHVMDANRELSSRIDELAAEVGDHRKAIALIFRELESLTQEPEPPRERIGFKPNRSNGASGKARGEKK